MQQQMRTDTTMAASAGTAQIAIKPVINTNELKATIREALAVALEDLAAELRTDTAPQGAINLHE